MKISVCVCAYNAEQTIARTIESVLKQTYPNFEIIVINDGSSDATQQIVERYQQETSGKITLKSIPNGGLANARNEALALCTGDLYISLDADDYLEPDTFEKAVTVISEDPQIDVCFYGVKHFDENGRFILSDSETTQYPKALLTGLEAFQQRTLRQIWIQPGNALYRLEMIRANTIRNHAGKNMGEDIYFISRCLLAARKVACFEGENFCYMVRSDSMSHAAYNPNYLQTLWLIDQLEEDVRCDYPEHLEEILPYVQSESLIQTLGVIKRMARYFPLKVYRKEAAALKNRISPYDAARAEWLPDWTKRLEYRVCCASSTAYYYLTRLYDRIH